MKSQFSLTLYFIALFGLMFSNIAHAIGNSIVTIDKEGIVGQYNSLALDSQDNPIISYYDSTEAKLKIVHCIEKNCTFLNIIFTPDSAKKVGQYTSLTLDHHGNPVVAYYDQINSTLKVLHCGNSSCSSDNTISTPDSAGKVGQYTSVIVDNHNWPVVSYYDASKGILKILHCGNTACSAGNSIVTPDTVGSNGMQSSIKLDATGNPVVAYFAAIPAHYLVAKSTGNVDQLLLSLDKNAVYEMHGFIKQYLSMADLSTFLVKNLREPSVKSAITSGLTKLEGIIAYWHFTQSVLKVLHCGNANCTADNSMITADSAGDVGHYPSLVLDMEDKPVVSYLDFTNGKLKVLRCGNITCSSGNSIASLGQSIVGYFSSIALDVNGHPIVSYYDFTHGNLNILRCGNVTCKSGNTILAPDTAGQVGQYTSLQLDSHGHPVVSYYDVTNGNLKLLHCGSSTCNPNTVTIADDESAQAEHFE